MDKVVILARVSTQAQDYQRQVTELQEYCDRAGWEVTRVFANKVSGAKAVTERTEIVEMVEYIKSNDIQRVVCLEISRLGRNTLEALKVINYLNETGKLIRKAFKWKLNGDANTTILYRLETLGLKISAQTLHKILVNPFYAGKIVHKLIKGEMVDGKIEPAISYTEFLKVQDILSGRTGKYAHQKENDRCPLTKYVICSEDDTPFTSYTKKKKEREFNYYKCNTSGCKTNISAKEMHEKYEDILNQYDLPECILRQFESTLREELQVVWTKGSVLKRCLQRQTMRLRI